MYLSLPPDEEPVDPVEPFSVLRVVLVNLLEPSGMLRVREEDPLELPGVREGIESVDPLEPPAVLRVSEG